MQLENERLKILEYIQSIGYSTIETENIYKSIYKIFKKENIIVIFNVNNITIKDQYNNRNYDFDNFQSNSVIINFIKYIEKQKKVILA